MGQERGPGEKTDYREWSGKVPPGFEEERFRQRKLPESPWQGELQHSMAGEVGSRGPVEVGAGLWWAEGLSEQVHFWRFCFGKP